MNSLFAQEDLESIEEQMRNTKSVQDLSDRAKAISLNEAIEIGLRNNNKEVLRQYQFQINELNFKDAFEDFYFPKLSLYMTTFEDHFVENVYRDPIKNEESGQTPIGGIGLGFEDYTLFNWGKDYLDYLNAQESFERNKQEFKEKRRELRFNIIVNYFNLTRLNEITRAYKKQLSHTSFIYRLAKEKLSLKKASSQEFLQAKAEFLNAHTNYQNALFEYYNQQQALADLLGDDLDSSYKPIDRLKFTNLTIDKDVALKYVLKNRPAILDAKTEVNNAKRSYQRVLKDNLPLPKLSLKLGTYQRTFSDAGSSDTFNTFNNSNNVEVAASVNMTWTIFGSGGFFNGRVTERAYYEKRIAEIKLKESFRTSKVANTMIYKRIQYLEKRYRAAVAQYENAKKVFDQTIDNYIGSKTQFADVRDVLQVLINSSIEMENVKYEHLGEKINYASVMGLDDFPGDRFEGMVEK